MLIHTAMCFVLFFYKRKTVCVCVCVCSQTHMPCAVSNYIKWEFVQAPLHSSPNRTTAHT